MTQWLLDRTFRTASGDEVRWATLGEGRADTPAVVLLHGTPFSSYVWRGVARALAARHRVFVWDMPGYGASQKRAGQDVSLAAQARVFTELLAHWGLAAEAARPAVVAHDFGGCAALRAHLLHGARYARLALVDPVALAPWGSPTYRLLAAHPDVFGQLPPDLHRALVGEYVSSASHPGLHPAVLDRLVEPWCTDEGRPAFYRHRTERPALHGRDPGTLRRTRSPDTDLLGRPGHLDPSHEGTRAGLPYPRRPSPPDRGRGPSGPGGRTR